MADDDMDFYELLEIDEDASQEEVKEAFRAKVREYHPDLNDDPDAPAQFNALKKAYETLNDSSERNAYDRLGHKDYVAKRIGGFPSGDIWNRSSGDDSGASSESGGSSSRSSGSSSSRSSSTRSSGSARSTSRSASASSSSSQSGGSSARSSGSSSRSSSSSRTASASGASASATSSTGRSTGSGTATSGGAGASATGTTGGGSATRAGTTTGGWTDNALFNWWNGLNLGWPLMLAAALLYVAGLAQYGMAHREGLATLADRLSAAGTDTAALRAALTGSRYGLTQPATFVMDRGGLVTDPPLPTQQWYAALGGLVGVTVLAFALNRAFRARRPFKWVTTNETVGTALALAIAAGAVGGPLLAGAVVLPLVYLVIVRHTRKAQRFKPTYLYVLGVSTPLLGLALDAAEALPSLAVDLVALVLPLVSVVVLLLSAFVRPRVTARF